MHLKKLILILTLCQVNGLLAHTHLKPLPTQWIALSPILFNTLKTEAPSFLNALPTLSQRDEIYVNIPFENLSHISHFVHRKFNRCGGFRILSHAPEIKPNNELFKRFPDVEFGEFWPNELDKLITLDYTLTRSQEVYEWFESTSETYRNSVIHQLTSYKTRYYKSPEGVAALEWIGKEWERLTSNRNDVLVTYFKHQNFEQPSIILRIQGSDEIKKNKIIILGGHGDSINSDDPEKGLRSPGADDNAAGIALLSDLIKLIVEKNYRPKHTIEFIAYAAEEVGLQGSNELAELYHKSGKQVIGVLQFDGVNFSGKTFDMALIADGTNKEQTLFVASIIDEYLKTNWTWEKCGYACSDHYSWHIQGYRASFPVESISSEQNPYIHTAEDTFEKSLFSSKKADLFEKLGIAYLLELDK